ncbi:MAG: hypothetical protein JSR34_01745 [Proteobacteria bacterium]|nr:hypothetical protein [Pseudomonadota bacterium]
MGVERREEDQQRMNQQAFQHLLRQTNVEDLLDDGIENGSDLKFMQHLDAAPESAKVPAASITGNDCEEPRSHAQEPEPLPAAEPSQPSSPSWFGLSLGIVFVIGGLLLLIHPHAILIFHQRISRLPSFVEYISANDMLFYAIACMLLGLGLCVFSLYRSRD